MAVRFPGTSGNFYSRSSDLPAIAAFTASWWVKLAASVTDRNNPFTIYADTSNYIDYQTRSDNGTLFQFRFAGNGSNVLNIVDVGVGNWYFMALVINGTAIDNYYAAATDSSLSVVSTTASSASWWTPAHMRLSQRPDTFGRINGTLAGIKMWTAALSQADIERERQSYRPVITDTLHLFTPAFDLGASRIRDYSGANRDWTSNGASIVDEDGPILSYGGSAVVIWPPPPVVVVPDEVIGVAAAFSYAVDRAQLWPAPADTAQAETHTVDSARAW